jgi:GR25 family glycosyltransferase involved in LPS biosynthesis
MQGAHWKGARTGLDQIATGINWSGYFINLDRSLDRRRAIEGQLERAGLLLAYRRFPAVDGRALAPDPKAPMVGPGLGCFLSHARLLAQALDGRDVHVLEDDAVLSTSFASIMSRLADAGGLDQYDLLFTDVILSDPPPHVVKSLMRQFEAATADLGAVHFRVLDLNGVSFVGANSYFVRAASLGKVRAILDREISLGPRTAVDLLYESAVKDRTLTAGCIFPFISSVQLTPEQSTLAPGSPDIRRILAHDLLRYAFYLDSDLDALRRKLTALSSGPPESERFRAIADVYRALLRV